MGANHSFPQVCSGFHHREHGDHGDGWGRRVRTGSETPFLPASVPSVPSVVKLRIAPAAFKRESWLAPMGRGLSPLHDEWEAGRILLHIGRKVPMPDGVLDATFDDQEVRRTMNLHILHNARCPD